MDAFDELERMITNAGVGGEENLDISPVKIERWQKLFSYTYEQAAKLIEEQLQDLTRIPVSDEHWDMVRDEFEPQGYDRNAYEHHRTLESKQGRKSKKSSKKLVVPLSQQDARKVWILKLEGPFSTPEQVQAVIGLPTTPKQKDDEDSGASFCYINGASKQAIIDWISENAPTFDPTFVHISKAYKELSTDSLYPTLGVDSTLPQHRQSNESDLALLEPQQSHYPVWYFFYGTLAQKNILSHKLKLPKDTEPTLYPATIAGGKLEMWGGKYKALIDGEDTSTVQGFAYEVVSEEHEDELRFYETDNYEVVRCRISMVDGPDGKEKIVQGCTFRFVGAID